MEGIVHLSLFLASPPHTSPPPHSAAVWADPDFQTEDQTEDLVVKGESLMGKNWAVPLARQECHWRTETRDQRERTY